MNDPEDPAGDDPFLEEMIRDAIGPLAALLPPAELAALRKALRDGATDDPALRDLYSAARPRKGRERSGVSDAHPAPEQAPGAVVPLRRKGGAA